MTHRFLGALLVSIFLTVTAGAAVGGPPPPPPIRVPGPLLGESRSRWVAPYVLELSYGTSSPADTVDCCCSPARDHVLWFDRNGKVENEILASVNWGYATDYSRQEEVYYGLVPRWELRLATNERTLPGLVSSSPTGNIFVHVTRPEDKSVALDVYRTGLLAYHAGPFEGSGWGGVEAAETGACALTVNEFDGGKLTILFDPAGREVLRSRSAGHDRYTPAPDGHAMARSGPHSGFALRSSSGETSVIPEATRVDAVHWSPDSRTVLAMSRYGHAATYYLIDGQSGTLLWSYADSIDQEARHQSAAFLPPYVLFYSQHGVQHRIVAVNASTGRTESTWTSSIEQSPPARLFPVNEEVYFVTDLRFSAIDAGAIAAGRDGWKSPEE